MDAHNRHHTYLRISLTERDSTIGAIVCAQWRGQDQVDGRRTERQEGLVGYRSIAARACTAWLEADWHDVQRLDKPITVRFIEYMPFSGNSWQATSLVPYKVLLQRIQAAFGPLERVQDDKNDTSKHWKVPGHRGKLGFITSMTDNFCGTCNRLRITADGNLKVCLFGNKEISLRDAMRHGILPSSSADFATSASHSKSPESATDEQLLDIINAALYKKHRKHAGLPSPDDIAKSDNRSMIRIAAKHSAHNASVTSFSSGARPSGARALLIWTPGAPLTTPSRGTAGLLTKALPEDL
ncbi:molybdenum cofactor biosynthesis pathway protein [Ceraceosorus bombacis]|uniref:Molybdenum cofactor biosynthesis pathway protein n=1 Tax=Ceraceosorus bombacis TaxID=401625 RepID=A0A0P1BJC1_9BASI|nr:molybdenum cofactor biosynthesis pathway protein [Ceraceosorus bombacis]